MMHGAARLQASQLLGSHSRVSHSHLKAASPSIPTLGRRRCRSVRLSARAERETAADDFQRCA